VWTGCRTNSKETSAEHAGDADVRLSRRRYVVFELRLALHPETVPAGQISREGERYLAYSLPQPRGGSFRHPDQTAYVRVGGLIYLNHSLNLATPFGTLGWGSGGMYRA